MMKPVSKNQIYDIYVVRDSGIPLFSGCTSTDYCRTDMEHHDLISGFFSALFSFSKETFRGDILETMMFGDIGLNFWYDADHELIFAFLHEKEADKTYIREVLQQSHDLFVDKYAKYFQRKFVDQTLFSGFRDLLRDAGIIEDNLMVTTLSKPNKNQNIRTGLIRRILNFFSLKP